MLPAATAARLLPEHVDLSIVLTTSGFGALAMTFVGVLRRHDGERLRRLALFGSMAGGIHRRSRKKPAGHPSTPPTLDNRSYVAKGVAGRGRLAATAPA